MQGSPYSKPDSNDSSVVIRRGSNIDSKSLQDDPTDSNNRSLQTSFDSNLDNSRNQWLDTTGWVFTNTQLDDF